jgi:hypothetical protein
MKLSRRGIETILWLLKEMITILLKLKKENRNETNEDNDESEK